MKKKGQVNFMLIRKAVSADLDALMPIFDEARGTIGKLGIDQWQDGYPQREVIEEDIRGGYTRVIETDGTVRGTFALFFDGEPTYDRIFDGHWLTGDENRNYLAVHRVAITVASRGTGLSGALIAHAEEEAKAAGKLSIRIDTHEGNVVMRRMLEKNGLQYCGIIYLVNGDPRVAYEKTV